MLRLSRRTVPVLVGFTVLALVCTVGPVMKKFTSPSQMNAGTLAASQERADEARMSWLGDSEAHQAASVIQAYQDNGAISECLRDRGIAWDWRRAIIGGSPITGGFAGSVWAASPDKWAQIPTFDWDKAWQAVVEKTLRTPLSAEGEKRYQSCRMQASEPQVRIDYESLGDEYTLPVAARELDGDWQSGLYKIDEALAPTESYYSCLATAELPGETMPGEDDANRLAARAWSLEPPKSVFAMGETPESMIWRETSEWSRFTESTKEFASKEFACRSERYPEAVSRTSEYLAQFTEAHDEKISKLHEHWAVVESQARLLGWTPERPHAGYHEPGP